MCVCFAEGWWCVLCVWMGGGVNVGVGVGC